MSLLLATADSTKAKIAKLEAYSRENCPQTVFKTEHVFHAGMYARTVRVPRNELFTSVLVKRATLLIINGDVSVLAGDEWIRMTGYTIACADAGRKQVYFSNSMVEMTMIFPTKARTVEEAEAEFTDETHTLLSRTMENDILVTPCLE